MACLIEFDLLVKKYGLEKTWDCLVSDGWYKFGPGYQISHRGRHFPYLGCLTLKTIESMTDTKMEEFVVECAVLSMQLV